MPAQACQRLQHASLHLLLPQLPLDQTVSTELHQLSLLQVCILAAHYPNTCMGFCSADKGCCRCCMMYVCQPGLKVLLKGHNTLQQ